MKTSLAINSPDRSDAEWCQTPQAERLRVSRWLQAMERCDSPAAIAAAMNTPLKTVYRKLGDYKASGCDWRALVDGRRAKPARECRTNLKHFRAHLSGLAGDHQRNSRAAVRKLREAWARRDVIPGYEDLAGWPAMPAGWSTPNLMRIIRETATKPQLRAKRVGTNSKSGAALAQVFSTRVGLYPGAVYQFDDVWHDHLVTVGRDRRPTRVLELGVLDLFSASRFAWGAKPRMPKADGSGMEGIKEREMRFFLASILWNFGYSPRGTILCAENGTAAIRDDIEAILMDNLGGAVTVRRAPIEGRQQALTGYWPGSEGGNFRAKAALESLHSLIHNDLANLPLQLGNGRDNCPVTTSRQEQYILRVMRDVLAKAPHRAELIQLPAWDFHSDFLPFLRDYYEFGLNGRTEHELEGWAKLGFIRTEYAAAPGTGQYLTGEQFLALPAASRLAISAAAQADPVLWTRKRSLSPAEVFQSGRSDLRRIDPVVVCDILTKDLAREAKVSGAYIEFQDIDISPEPLIYEARMRCPEGAFRELASGEKYQVFANPFAPETLFMQDASGRYLGACPLVKRVGQLDNAAFRAAAGHKAQRNAEILQPLRIRHAEAPLEAQAMREHNRRVIAGDPILPEEISAARSLTARASASARLGNNQEDNTWETISARDLPVPELESVPADLSDLL